ncbi:MAG: protein kinase [Deltaproteobacteria bacterium]|nr:protein kinase [Deltaproteobacteria bacterium]
MAATESSNPKMAAAGIGEAPSLTGKEIAGRYRLQKKLGEGGMGAVYKAEQISLKRACAVKLLRPEVANSQMLLRRFNAEAELVAKLSHPNTVNIYDFGQDSDGSLFIAMEYIEGKSLRDVIHQEAPIPLPRALKIASQIASSLVDAHAHKIVHRDLKPDNVMLQERGRQKDVVRVLDFGIAKLRDENRQSQLAMTQAGDMLGTPQYMSPEQIRGETIDGRTDIYSLGGLLYEMVTGRLPFEAPTVMALLSKHLLETIVPPSQRRPDLNLPPAIDHLILGAMAKNAAERPPTMEQFGEQIAALQAQFPADTTVVTAQATAQQPAMTRPHSLATPASGYPPSGGFVPPAPPQNPYPPPQPPPNGFAPPHGAPPYDPYAHAQQPPMLTAQPKSGSPLIWIVLALLVLSGIGIGVYFGVIKKNDGDKPTPGSGSEGSGVIAGNPTATPDAAVASPPPGVDAGAGGNVDDPWAKGGGTTIPSTGDVDDPDEPYVGTPVEDDPDEPTPTPATGGKGMPPACEEYAKIMERMGKCKVLPEQSRKAMLDAVKQLRKSYGSIQWTPEISQQVSSACKQGSDAMKQAIEAYNCGP